MNLILLNGPPRSGKDTIARYILSEFGGTLDRFSMPLKRAFAGFINSPIDEYGDVQWWEENKDQVGSLGVSYRQWQIEFSEKLCKPLCGNDIFVRLLLRRLPQDGMVVIPDCGFQIEVNGLYHALPHANILFLQVHRLETSFANDSRALVRPPGDRPFYIIDNSGTLTDLYTETKTIVGNWLASLKR